MREILESLLLKIEMTCDFEYKINFTMWKYTHKVRKCVCCHHVIIL